MKHHPQPLNWRSLAIKNQQAFTLTELLVSMGLSMFVLAGVGSLFRAQSHTVKGQESKMEANEYALTVLDMVVREVRNAGYFPSIACDATGGITSATATAVTIQYDKNSNGACSGDDEIVVFAYDSANKNVTRNGVALSDGNVTAIEFIYYPQHTSGSPPLPYCTSTNVPSGCSGTLSSSYKTVQKITISLTVAPKSTDSDFIGAPVTMSLTADLRNHGV